MQAQAVAYNPDDLLDRYCNDFRLFAEDCLFVKDHNTARVVPLIFNNGQRILHIVAEKQKAEKGYIRILLLKTRRFGGSTYVEGRFYWKSSLNFNRHTFIVGHEKKSTSTLFRMAKLMHQKNPLAPATLASNAQELRFDDENGTGLKSEYALASAKNVDTGRSQGIHYLHDSEEGFWPDAETLLTGLMQCVPDPPAESEVFRESTANGYGNTFQRDVFEAYAEGEYSYYTEDGITYAWSNPDTDWILVFIPWFAHERYTKSFESKEEKLAFAQKIEQKVFDSDNLQWVDSEALKLQKRFKLTLEQLHWREWAIQNKCRGSLEKFRQEYPATVEEAFLSQGSNVFGQELCDQLEALCEKPIIVGDVVMRAGKPRIRPNRHGKFSLWEKPDPDETYFITVDAAGGKKKRHEAEKKEPDFTNIDVWNHRTGIQAAQWHGHIEYDLIADVAEMIGDMFFRAPACVELQNHGYTVVANLKAKKYPMFEAKPDEPGWLTNRKTKPMMIDSLYQMARDGGIQIRCVSTVSEMRTYIEENGEYGAESNCKDDRVMTAAMASQMMTLLPKKFKEMRDKRKKFTGFKNWHNHLKKGKKNSGEYTEIYATTI